MFLLKTFPIKQKSDLGEKSEEDRLVDDNLMKMDVNFPTSIKVQHTAASLSF